MKPLAMSIALGELPLGEVAIIRSLNLGQEYRRRMAGLGLRPGVAVRVIRRSPFGGPLQVRAGHTDIILRRTDAARILVDPQPPLSSPATARASLSQPVP